MIRDVTLRERVSAELRISERRVSRFKLGDSSSEKHPQNDIL